MWLPCFGWCRKLVTLPSCYCFAWVAARAWDVPPLHTHQCETDFNHKVWRFYSLQCGFLARTALCQRQRDAKNPRKYFRDCAVYSSDRLWGDLVLVRRYRAPASMKRKMWVNMNGAVKAEQFFSYYQCVCVCMLACRKWSVLASFWRCMVNVEREQHDWTRGILLISWHALPLVLCTFQAAKNPMCSSTGPIWILMPF